MQSGMLDPFPIRPEAVNLVEKLGRRYAVVRLPQRLRPPKGKVSAHQQQSSTQLTMRADSICSKDREGGGENI